MMQWTKGDIGFETKEAVATVPTVSEDRLAPAALFNHVVETLAVTLSRVGVTSAAAAVMMALLIATVLLGISAEDAMAMGQWCRSC